MTTTVVEKGPTCGSTFLEAGQLMHLLRPLQAVPTDGRDLIDQARIKSFQKHGRALESNVL